MSKQPIKANLDYDNALASDAQSFGLDVKKPELPLPIPLPVEPVEIVDLQCSLKDALLAARDVYGESNSHFAEDFYRWVQSVFSGQVSETTSKEMLQLLYQERAYWGMRMQIARRGKEMRARRNAVLSAQAVVRAVLNHLAGRTVRVWIQKCLWRASLAAESDNKSDGYGRGDGREGSVVDVK